jgi:hypothetical protein
MGKALIWLGEKIVLFNQKLKMWWNKLIIKLVFKMDDCNGLCEKCKKCKFYEG